MNKMKAPMRSEDPDTSQAIQLHLTKHSLGSNALVPFGAKLGQIKPSLSMTSLPPDGQQQHSAEVIEAKLRVERPYNSLKKKRNSERETWRHSWGSGHSHSSCSLHSNATGVVGVGLGKDEFWAALQTNYNYIMDTNLLDTCKEARCEIEVAASIMLNQADCCSKMLETTRNELTATDPKELRKWLRNMETEISKFVPSSLVTKQMSSKQLQNYVADYSVLYHEIASHARVVGACIKASANECNRVEIISPLSTADEKIKRKTPSPTSKKHDGNLKGLEDRYHLLYLKAYEIQVVLEELLKEKSSSLVSNESGLYVDFDTDDEEPITKVARISNSENSIRGTYDVFDGPKATSEDNDSKDDGDDEREEEEHNFTKSATRRKQFASISSENSKLNDNVINLPDFDADSEGSENETVKRRKNDKYISYRVNKSVCEKNNSIVICGNMDSKSVVLNNDGPFYSKNNGSILDNFTKCKNSIQHVNLCTPKVYIGQEIKVPSNPTCSSNSGDRKRTRNVDLSSFNRSNRKSKNCATFYFKHLDTDNETNVQNVSSCEGYVVKSLEQSSDDEGSWTFSASGDINKLTQNSSGSGSDKENKVYESDITSSSQIFYQANINLTTSTSSTSSMNNNNMSRDDCMQYSYTNGTKEMTKESIKQLVLEAEHIVREDSLKTPTKHFFGGKQPSLSTEKKRDMNINGHHVQKVKEWLEHQPISNKENLLSIQQQTTDCEASGEASESDSLHRMSDDSTSEGFTDSIATCMQTGSTSNGNSTEIICESIEPIQFDGSNISLNVEKVIRRQNRRKADRPWSVSCISQLTTSSVHLEQSVIGPAQVLSSHSISESALDSISPVNVCNGVAHNSSVKAYDSRGSLKRRKIRKKKQAGKKGGSGSEGLLQDWPKITTSLFKIDDEKLVHNVKEIENTFSLLNPPTLNSSNDISSSEQNSEEERILRKPNFRVGSLTTSYMSNVSNLGSLAALACTLHDKKKGYNTEDHNSSFSETAWDDYQEKYNSENYSEGFDSDAARRLMEFGDDYRNFLDSQSDCCSSLSAANNLDSLSPPRLLSLPQGDGKVISQDLLTGSVDHARRRRALELEYERRRKTLEMRRKSTHDEVEIRSSSTSINSANAVTPKNPERQPIRSLMEAANRKLDYGITNSTHSLRRTSESDNSSRRRKMDDRRRSSRTLEKSFKVIQGTSSSNDNSDEEKDFNNLLEQTRTRHDDTKALQIRSHLLRPEDYDEIVSTCRDNIHCLDAVLKGAKGSLLSTITLANVKNLLSSWEELLGWSENAGSARKMQEDMIILKQTLNRLGGKSSTELDSESTIQIAIEELKKQKTDLQTYRTNMLRLNASVHSWLTRQEMQQPNSKHIVEDSNEIIQIGTFDHSKSEFYKHLKDDVSEMYSAWDEADARIKEQLEALTASLIAWRQLECGLSEFQQVLGKDRGTLKGLEGALQNGNTTPVELANNVKLVAKLLSEKVDISHQQLAAVQQQLDPNTILHIAQLKSSSGSLSDSGISDGGATSDGGLSERERRLVVLRRLVKQLESALAPGSDAMKTIASRMESAESDLKILQNTCRELIVRTAASHSVTKPHCQQKRKYKNSPSKNKDSFVKHPLVAESPDFGDPEDPKNYPQVCEDGNNDKIRNNGWAWKRLAKIALPMQITLLTILCAACLLQPNCCDNLNNLSMSFTPQLRYVRGPPPI